MLTALLVGDFPTITCIAFAAPACASEPLADALKPLVLSIVHNDDLVPRLSDCNCHQLAIDLIADDALYKERFAKDKSAYYNYVKTLGKVS